MSLTDNVTKTLNPSFMQRNSAMEENLEQRIQRLEKKCRVLTQSGFILLFFVAYAVLSGSFAVYRDAMAQLNNNGESSNRRIRRNKQNTRAQQDQNDAGTKTAGTTSYDEQDQQFLSNNINTSVVEGQIFILKDAQGNIRGVWSADDETTSFSMTYKKNHPIIGMAVDQANATMSLTDSRQGKISLSLADSIRSLSITDDTEKNNIYMGLTGAGDASFDMVSTKSSSVVVDGAVSRIDLTGDKAIVALAETVGSSVALQSAPSMAGLTFVDFRNNQTMQLSTVDGVTEMSMVSLAKDEIKKITTQPDLPPAPEAKPEEEEDKAAEAKEEEGKNTEEKPQKTDKPETKTEDAGKTAEADKKA